MPLYALMAATVLSLVRAFVFHRAQGRGSVLPQEGWATWRGNSPLVEENGFVGMLVAALLPPPTPFKIFVFARAFLRCRCGVTPLRLLWPG